MPKKESLDPLRVKKMKPVPAILLVLAAIGAISFVDYATGNELSVSVLYLIPITVAVFLLGRNFGLAVSVLSSSLIIIMDLLAGKAYPNLLIPAWNAVAGFLYYVFHALLLSTLIGQLRTIRSVSYKDPLTDAANWRYFEEYLGANLRELSRQAGKLAVAYLDIDDFKSLNDRWGHSVGDEVLKEVVRVAKGNIRANDMIARLGGDEFAILLTDIDYERSAEVLGRIKHELIAEMEKREWKVTFSMGATVFSDARLSIRQIMQEVDRAMYAVKNSGKDGLKIELR